MYTCTHTISKAKSKFKHPGAGHRLCTLFPEVVPQDLMLEVCPGNRFPDGAIP